MLFNKKMIVGVLLIAAGTLAVVSVKLNNMPRDKGSVNMIIGLVLFGAGIYFLAKGKKQQLDERENRNN